MSIFKVNDIDTILVNYLDIDSLRNLYQTDTYYRNLIRPSLDSFIKFFSEKVRKMPHNEQFIESIKCGDIEIVKYLQKSYTLCNCAPFNLACINGHLNIAKLLHPDKFCCSRISNFIFRETCDNGHLDVAKWLYNSVTNVALYCNFSSCCQQCNNINMIKWLDTILSNKDYVIAFQSSCFSDKLETAQYLYSQNMHLLFARLNNVFVETCANNSLHVAKWLHSLGVNIRHNNDNAFRLSCYENATDVIHWLCSIEPRYSVERIINYRATIN